MLIIYSTRRIKLSLTIPASSFFNIFAIGLTDFNAMLHSDHYTRGHIGYAMHMWFCMHTERQNEVLIE
jgi:hypothetical protein